MATRVHCFSLKMYLEFFYVRKFNNSSDCSEIMKTKTKILVYLSILALLDMIIPIPFTSLMLIYVVLEKPAWFKDLVAEIY